MHIFSTAALLFIIVHYSVKQMCFLSIKARKPPLVAAQNKNAKLENKHNMSPFCPLKVGCFVFFLSDR